MTFVVTVRKYSYNKSHRRLCQQYGIDFVETEEANTSAASFLDGDSLPKYGEKTKQWKSSGKRVKRGLFRTTNVQEMLKRSDAFGIRVLRIGRSKELRYDRLTQQSCAKSP
jgi:hypothetical protein